MRLSLAANKNIGSGFQNMVGSGTGFQNIIGSGFQNMVGSCFQILSDPDLVFKMWWSRIRFYTCNRIRTRFSNYCRIRTKVELGRIRIQTISQRLVLGFYSSQKSDPNPQT